MREVPYLKGLHRLKIMSFYDQVLAALRKRNKMIVCPQCKHSEFITKPDVVEMFRDVSYPYSDIVCENCGWIGEPDELDED